MISRISTGSGCTEAIVLNPEKAEGGRPGDRHLFDADGTHVASRPCTTAPQRARDHLRLLAARPRPYVAGGVSYLPCLERMRLVIVGAGHVGQKVAELASQVDFEVWVVDDREEYCNPGRFPDAKRLIVAPIDSALSGLDVDPNTFCIIVTRGHNHDEEALYHLAESTAAYVGMIGSKRKIKLIFEDLRREGVSSDALAKVRAPLGFHIGSQSVPEIAISIVAELISHRNLGTIPDVYRHIDTAEQTTEAS
jgi:xanthine dehydrogenase accessory factor